MEQIAVCEYCGQTFMSDLPTEAERKKEALMKCSVLLLRCEYGSPTFSEN